MTRTLAYLALGLALSYCIDKIHAHWTHRVYYDCTQRFAHDAGGVYELSECGNGSAKVYINVDRQEEDVWHQVR